jgi:3-hydroxyisobutyrate dehydrogenase-like beta-hydroxyacid dehydrogenase
MAAGDRTVFERVRPLLETFGGSVFHVGPTPGQGQLAKLLNNLLSATALAITCEAMTVGVRAGLDPATLLEAFSAGSGRNTATTDKFPKHVLTRRFASGFRLALMAKDVELCMAEARRRQLPMLVGGLVQQLWTLAAARSEPDADHTEFVRLIESWSGAVVGGSVGAVDE